MADLLTPEQVAQRCRLSRRAIYRAIERGELRATRICSRLRVDPADLDDWIAAGAVALTTPSTPVERTTTARAGGRLRAILDGAQP